MLKLYPTKFEVMDVFDDIVAKFEAFDDEALEVELLNKIWNAEDLRRLADVLEIAENSLKNGLKVECE